MTIPNGCINTTPVARFSPAGGGSGSGLLSMPDAALENVLWVQETTEVYVPDGSVQLPYTSIDAAVNAAAALLPTASNPVAIVVMPGEYDESVTLDTDYVYLFGWNRDTTILMESFGGALSITSEYTAVWGMTIRTLLGVGAPVDVDTGTTAVAVEFNECRFDKTGSADAGSTAVTVSGSLVRFIDCDFQNRGFDVDVLKLDTAAVGELWDCTLNGGVVQDQTDDLYLYRCTLDDGYVDCGSTGALFIFECRIVTASGSAVRLTAAAQLEIKSCYLESQASNKDISASTAVTGCVVENNVMMADGIDPDVSHVNPVKWVGSAGHKDFYLTTQEALTACTFADCTVKLLKDETAGAIINPPGVTFRIFLDGNGKHTLTLANSIDWDLGAYGGRHLYLRDIIINGHINVYINTSTQYLTLDNVELNGGIRLGLWGGTCECRIIDSLVAPNAGFSVGLQIQQTYHKIYILRSRVRGTAATVPIQFASAAGQCDNVQIAYSTLWHGSGAANNPFARTGAQTPNWKGAHNAFNVDPDAAGWSTNLVAAGQQQSSFDVQTDY